ncbi:TRAP transporter large permease subunit [Frigoribacterium sp. RIT-PI-h]|uniref:TRAP transporter large permease subunit n=1 Tax=Frigoribacterium sp. RIT-PI-h TaxID=1690245 RepID=UPI0006CC5634|nr:TRAP transporter large permease subunit [Frigoribacterium sp. RIT-PI-h]KPG82431.1 C4-dicarboxylate ABC transporter permease [Frigoribacterium sp. RIT-PI-h]
MGISVWALIVYLAVIVVWAVLLKRGIGEAMIIGFIALCGFGGPRFFELFATGLGEAFAQPVVFAALSFTFIGFVLTQTGIIEQQVAILNSMLGRLRGGAGYVSTIASAGFGALTHSASANAATIGSVTIPWMARSNWKKDTAAAVVAGNSGNGTVIPPSAAFLIIIGLATVSPNIDQDTTLVAMFAVAGYCILWRLLVVFYFVRRYRIARVAGEDLLPLRRSLRAGWLSLVVYVGIAAPVVITVGVGGELLASWLGSLGEDAVSAINILLWIPVLLGLIAIVIGHKKLPKTFSDWYSFIASTGPRYKDIGATLVFSFAGSAVLLGLGLNEQLQTALNSLEAPAVVTVFLVVLIIAVVGGPLSATATAATLGGVAFTVLTAAGIDPTLAVCAVLVAISTEGASPPGGPSIFIAAGIAEVNPAKTFAPLVIWYVVPFLVIAVVVAFGLIPIPH